MSTARKREEKQGFEARLQRLEEIVQKLEQGDVPLDESLKMYEEGLRLSRQCMQELQEAEIRIRKLMKDAAGRLTLAEFADDESGEDS